MTIPVPLLSTPVADPANTVTFPDRAAANFLELNPIFAAANVQNAENNVLHASVTTNGAAAATAAAMAGLAAQQASASMGALPWVSGTTYGLGASAYDAVDGVVYERTVAGAGATRPGLDSPTWKAKIFAVQTLLPKTRPAINLDFVNSGIYDPRATFARATAAHRVNASGVVVPVLSGAPRLSHDLKTHRPRGYLTERASTNLFLQSRNFASASWAKTAGTVTASASDGPFGPLSMARFTESTDAVNTNHRLTDSFTADGTSRYVFSAYLKYAGRKINVFAGGFAGGIFARFDLLAGEVFANLAIDPTLTAGIEDCGDGVYLCWMSSTVPAGTAVAGVMLVDEVTNGASYTGSGTLGVFVDAWQAEPGYFPTSHINTTTAAATRNLDNGEISLVSLLGAGQTRGTFLIEAEADNPDYPSGAVFNQWIFALRTAGPARVFGGYYGANSETIAGVGTPRPHNKKPVRIALSFDTVLGTATTCINGALSTVAATTPGAIETIRLGAMGGNLPGAFGPMDGCIRRATYWQENLTPTEMIALTTWSPE